jgi:hypothetical protein
MYRRPNMTAGFTDYLREAFNAKPWGMFVAPNWIGITAFGFLGIMNPGFWILGAGLELAYLYLLTSNGRFRRWVDGRLVGAKEEDWNTKVAARVQQLAPQDATRFRSFEKRCQAVLAQQKAAGAISELDLQAEGLGRLTWIYLGLLNARQTLVQIMQGGGGDLSGKIGRLETQLENETDENLRQSLSSQLDILRQRATTQGEGRTKIAFLEAELDRIDQQVELIREQALLAGDAESVSRRIDEVGATLGSTSQWIRDQQKIYGQVQDLIDEAPPLPRQETQ